MSAYTAGPWRIREDGTVQQDGSKHLWICAPIDIPRREGGENATVANSTLIAAAPELLEALRMMVATGQPVGSYGNAAYIAAKAAIAKAEGK